jgi:hypothetical protein
MFLTNGKSQRFLTSLTFGATTSSSSKIFRMSDWAWVFNVRHEIINACRCTGVILDKEEPSEPGILEL